MLQVPQASETTNVETQSVAAPVADKAPPEKKVPSKKAEPKTKAPAKKKAAPKAKKALKAKGKKPAKAKQGLPRGVQRVTAALASLRRSATAEEISEVMGVGRAAAIGLLGASTSEDPTTAIGAGLVKALIAGGPDAIDGERVLRYQLTAKGKGMAEQATKKAGSAKKAAQRPMSQIQAAIEVLRTAEESMNLKEIMDATTKKGLWESPDGKTPRQSLSSVIQRDIQDKHPRIKRAGRGHFVLTALGAKS